MDSYMTAASAATLRLRPEYATGLSGTGLWLAPQFGLAPQVGSASFVAGSATYGHVGSVAPVSVVSVAPMSANAGIDTRPAAKQTRPPRWALR
jgi:hypothetical protein